MRDLKDLSTFEFVTRDDKVVNLKEFLSQDDYWTQMGWKVVGGKRQQVPVGTYIKHRAIQRLAEETGIWMNEVQVLVSPLASNENEHLFMSEFVGGREAHIRELDKEPLYKDRDLVTYEVGESSTRNTSPGISRKYMGVMAFKRLFDRGILNRLGFYELYSEDEAEEFSEDKKLANMSDADFAGIKDYLEAFSMSPTIKDLDKVKAKLVANKNSLNLQQKEYLRTTYKTCLIDLELKEDPLAETPDAVKNITQVERVEDKPQAPDPLSDEMKKINEQMEKEAQTAEGKVKGG